MTNSVKQKVYAYITHNNNLLVFRHTHHPEAGIQVPGGTLEPNETPAAGVLREAQEETGLSGLQLVSFLGQHEITFADGTTAVRHFFHLTLTEQPPKRWQHLEQFPYDGSPPVMFDLYWVSFPDGVPDLIGKLDAFLGQLILSEHS